MINKVIKVIVLLVFTHTFAQNTQWKSYFSYNEIRDISTTDDKVIVATDNAIFSKNTTSGELKTFTSVDGFKPYDITTLYYSDSKKIIFVGNSNGLFQIITADNKVINKQHIISEIQVSPVKKKINHIFEHQNKIYLSCDFGIVVFNTDTLEFGDTLFIGTTGGEIIVNQTALFNGNLYAATAEGIKYCSITDFYINDFSHWTTLNGGGWLAVGTLNNHLIGVAEWNELYKLNGLQSIQNLGSTLNDFRIVDNEVIITTNSYFRILNNALQTTYQVSSIPTITDTFTCVSKIGNQLFLGTLKSGLFENSTISPTEFTNISPNGPIRNYIFRVKTNSEKIYALHGAYNRYYNPHNPIAFEEGISIFNEQKIWKNIPYSELLGANSLSSLAFHPTQKNNVSISSYHRGLLEIDNETITLFDQTNTGVNGLESLDVGGGYISVRVNGPAYDKSANLWMTVNMIKKGIKVLRNNGQWQSYNLENKTTNPETESYGPLLIDKNNTKWIPTLNNGIIAFNENYNNKFILIKSGTEGNLPDTDVRTIAIDKNNQLWIGTYKGLRILQSVDSFINETALTTKNIVIDETGDGVGEELFYQQSIIDIAVDGANNKWVSIAGAGIFQISSNGQKTLKRFTSENSPLPSNNINDIEIDPLSGEVFFGTEKGLVSFLGSATQAANDLSQVIVYPNPVRPTYTGEVTITGLIDDANIKITDIEGNLVYETTSVGGSVSWDTTAFGKYKVASGVYMIFISSEDGVETTVKKVMIIR